MRAIKGAQNASQVLCEAAGDLLHVNSGTADSPLQMACYFGHVAAVKVLLLCQRPKLGLNTLGESSHSLTPFMAACINGSCVIVRLLLRAGSGLTGLQKEDGETVWDVLRRRGDEAAAACKAELTAHGAHESDIHEV